VRRKTSIDVSVLNCAIRIWRSPLLLMLPSMRTLLNDRMLCADASSWRQSAKAAAEGSARTICQRLSTKRAAACAALAVT
jgi:hypothetical protein